MITINDSISKCWKLL